MDDMSGIAQSLPPSADQQILQQMTIKKEEEENSEENTEPISEVNPNKLVGGKAYTVAGKYDAIKDIVGNYGIIGEFHKTIDGGWGICYIRMPKAESEQKTMLDKFNNKNILVWREKVVKQSTNGYELDLAIEEHLQFARANKDTIKFLENGNNNEESNNSTKIAYILPKGCYCKLKPLKPDDDDSKPTKPVGTPNKCNMGVKIDSYPKNTYNSQISMERLTTILGHHD
ncbi:uncharacterized protein LOC124313376 [Daphnia pulicaria]|uniref:uncharacterized protein LOC124313376 n=1 Tax=Daphnia pulicaria TaxID=35523 RepID=UPI001EEB04B8|nr:uncharacterized protein LOC124313376 [Daphnia pulicaria]